MTSAALSTPTTAELVRSACLRTTAAILATDSVAPAPAPVHHLLSDGSVALTVPTDSEMAEAAAEAGTAGTEAVLELTDYAPLPLREPVRSLVWIRGRVHAVPPHALHELLDMVAAARPDPHCSRSAPGSRCCCWAWTPSSSPTPPGPSPSAWPS